MKLYRCPRCAIEVQARAGDVWHACPKAAHRGDAIQLKEVIPDARTDAGPSGRP